MATKVNVSIDNNIPKRLRLQITRAVAVTQYHKQFLELFKVQVRKFNFGGLKASTIRRRRQIAKFNKTHPEYRASRDNLTLSGELIDTFKSKFVTSKFLFLLIPSKKKHKRYKSSGKRKTKKSSSTATNEQIIKFQGQLGRELSDVFTDQFVKKVEKDLVKTIRRQLRL